MKAYFQLLRPHQWLKNLMLLFPPFLGGTLLGGHYSSGQLLWPLVAFCLGSSATYIVNDICDVEQDRLHARKKHRPLAAGRIGVRLAVVLAVVFAAGAVAGAWWVSARFLVFLLLYLGVSLVYSLWLKDMPLVELFCVVSGFLLRLLAGGEAYGVAISDWLFLSVFLLALFLVSGKRLSELRHEGGEAPERIRSVLACYPQGFLEGCMLLSGSAVLVTYTMYVISHQSTIWVIPLSCFGLLAFWRRVLSGRGGDPTRALLMDPCLFIAGVGWVVVVGWSVYG
ncbi:4-hydroxybenzoate polyprenyltransferase [Geothermobacter ehrlichii]|uniref:4-hydroxybenzoate polyprenyltransferase n=1 Tax=Geothermobacter ehrlichii TaxID=213224 RepID=A0A5D3WQT0_9BACT|nr:decaprenyl-phosphate phosphoribosyltransferase [Geothermobacter ehrlichii]TYO99948.1 4-hydroxybenzoate polyprenyltransferase [Geothermobacter ehrlichii]